MSVVNTSNVKTDYRKLLSDRLAASFSPEVIENIKKSSYRILPDKITVTLNESAPITEVTCDKLKTIIEGIYQDKEVIFLGTRPISLPYHKKIWEQVRQQLRDNIFVGVNLDKAWFADDRVKVTCDNDDIIVQGKNDFFNGYIKNNYERALQDAFATVGFSLDMYYPNAMRFVKDAAS